MPLSVISTKKIGKSFNISVYPNVATQDHTSRQDAVMSISISVLSTYIIVDLLTHRDAVSIPVDPYVAVLTC